MTQPKKAKPALDVAQSDAQHDEQDQSMIDAEQDMDDNADDGVGGDVDGDVDGAQVQAGAGELPAHLLAQLRAGTGDYPQGYRCGLVAVVGRPNVGKSTLVNRLVGFKVSITSKRPQTTRHRIHGILTQELMQAVFVDTPGFQTRVLNKRGALNRQLNRTVTQAVTDVDLVVFVVEALQLTEHDRRVLDLVPAELPVIAVVNKCDRVTPRERLLPFLAELSKVREFAAIVPISAEKGTQCDALIGEVQKHLPESGPMFPDDQPTDRSERFIASELIREKIFRLTGDELPYACTVQIDQYEELPKLRRIYATIVVERDTHKAIVIGEGGLRLKRISSEARVEIEKMLGVSVYLEVFVKVRSGWADNEAALRAYGYE